MDHLALHCRSRERRTKRISAKVSSRSQRLPDPTWHWKSTRVKSCFLKKLELSATHFVDIEVSFASFSNPITDIHTLGLHNVTNKQTFKCTLDTLLNFEFFAHHPSKAFIWGRFNANLEFGALWGSPAFYSWISNFKLYTIRFIPNTFSAKIIHPLNFLQALVIWSYTFCNCSLGINCCCWEIRNVIRKLDITNNNCHFKTGAFRRPQINALLTTSLQHPAESN